MTATVQRFRALASRLIDKEGGLIVVSRVTAGALNAAEQTRAADVEVSMAVKAVGIPYTPLMGTGLGLTMEQGRAMLRDGQVFKIAAPGLLFEPMPGDRLTDAAGVTRTIISSVRTAPDGNAVAFSVAAAR